MTDSRQHDPVWQAAVDWVSRTHGHPPASEAMAALNVWLAESPAHRRAYEEAARVWLITGLLPPSEDGSNSSF